MQGSLLSNADEGDNGIIEDFDDSADLKTLLALGFVVGANVHVLQTRGGSVKVVVNDNVQSLSRELAETVILEA